MAIAPPGRRSPLCCHQEISRMTEFECILDEPISSAWPVASDWLETFLHDGGNRWDHRIASAMTADAVTAALAHTNRPVRLVGATTGATAQIGLQAHSTGQPQELSLIHISEPTRLLSISYAVFCLPTRLLSISYAVFCLP